MPEVERRILTSSVTHAFKGPSYAQILRAVADYLDNHSPYPESVTLLAINFESNSDQNGYEVEVVTDGHGSEADPDCSDLWKVRDP